MEYCLRRRYPYPSLLWALTDLLIAVMLKWHRPVRFLMAERHGSVPRATLVTRAVCLAMDEGAGAAIEKLLEEDAMPASAHGIASRRECDAALRAALRKRLFVGGWQHQSRPVYACTIRASQDPMRRPATGCPTSGPRC
ncbi:protein of unknown function [Shinella sp. WSC3-e]|nr:hypothetical protein SHINE37_40417 [Rhizobiaceae bacterium]CAK7255097.1 protein of unknown function [Shinella sp. WSC3-e]